MPSQNVLFGNGLAWSPAGKKIAFGGDHGVQVFDVESATTRRLRGLSDVNCVAWSGCGTRLTAGGHNTELWTWDVQTGRTTMNYNRLEQHPFSLEWSPDGQTVAAGGIIANIYLWNACQLERPTLLTPTWGRICINWHPNGQLLASRTRDGDVAIWHVVTRQRLFNFQADQIGSENWGTIVWTRDGTTLVTTGQRRVFLWSLKNRELEVVAAPIDN